MPTKTYTVTINGNAMNINDSSPPESIFIEGNVSLYRVRAQKNGSGDFAFNIDASASKSGKYPPFQNAILDIDPKQIEPDKSDGDNVSDIPNNTGSNQATTPSGAEATFESAGNNITGNPVLEIGSSTKLSVSSDVPSFASGEEFTVLLVVDQGGNDFRPAIGSDNATGMFSYSTWYGNNSQRRVFIRDESNNSVTSTNQDYFQDQDIRVLTKDSSNNVKEYRRGSEVASGTISGTMNFETIGWAAQNIMNGTVTYIWNGFSLSRLIICDYKMNDSDRENAEAWLAWEYGLQTSSNSYLPSSHAGYQSDPRTSPTYSFNSDIDISSVTQNTWSSYFGPNVTTIAGSIDIIPTKAYKADVVTIEVLVSY